MTCWSQRNGLAVRARVVGAEFSVDDNLRVGAGRDGGQVEVDRAARRANCEEESAYAIE